MAYVDYVQIIYQALQDAKMKKPQHNAKMIIIQFYQIVIILLVYPVYKILKIVKKYQIYMVTVLPVIQGISQMLVDVQNVYLLVVYLRIHLF
jgi:hypothetical protein